MVEGSASRFRVKPSSERERPSTEMLGSAIAMKQGRIKNRVRIAN
jgi:hypothetical protein